VASSSPFIPSSASARFLSSSRMSPKPRPVFNLSPSSPKASVIFPRTLPVVKDLTAEAKPRIVSPALRLS
jgi:hypothetical protein